MKTESLLTAAPNNAIRMNFIKAKIGNTQQDRKCRLFSDRDETINHIISKCSKLAQKEYKTRQMSRKGDLLGIVQKIEI